jgi:hypothetical protein
MLLDKTLPTPHQASITLDKGLCMGKVSKPISYASPSPVIQHARR